MRLRGLLDGLLRRQSTSVGPACEWAIHLTIRVIDWESGEPNRLKSIPLKARLTTSQAEELLAQDQRLQLMYGRWKGKEFEEGKEFALWDSHDVVFQSPDGLHGVRLKCPPMVVDGRPAKLLRDCPRY